jgi:hypothetical protein
LRMQRGVTWQRSCKKSRERAGVRGRFCTLYPRKSPLIRPNDHLLPPRGRRDFVQVANIDEKATSVKTTLQTWRGPVRSPKVGCSVCCQN